MSVPLVICTGSVILNLVLGGMKLILPAAAQIMVCSSLVSRTALLQPPHPSFIVLYPSLKKRSEIGVLEFQLVISMKPPQTLHSLCSLTFQASLPILIAHCIWEYVWATQREVSCIETALPEHLCVLTCPLASKF